MARAKRRNEQAQVQLKVQVQVQLQFVAPAWVQNRRQVPEVKAQRNCSGSACTWMDSGKRVCRDHEPTAAAPHSLALSFTRQPHLCQPTFHPDQCILEALLPRTWPSRKQMPASRRPTHLTVFSWAWALAMAARSVYCCRKQRHRQHPFHRQRPSLLLPLMKNRWLANNLRHTFP